MSNQQISEPAGPPRADEQLREQAVTELRKRRDFAGHALTYLTVNTFLVVIWYLTGAHFFWPIFPLCGWGIGVIMHAWDVFWPQPSESTIRSAMDRIARRS